MAKWTDDLLTTYDFDFSSPSDEEHDEEHDEGHDEGHDEDHDTVSIVTSLTTLSQYIPSNSIDSTWKIIASSAYRNRMIAWALKVVHCEAFVMPVCMPSSYFFHSILQDHFPAPLTSSIMLHNPHLHLIYTLFPTLKFFT
jgi:hypothetical protein